MARGLRTATDAGTAKRTATSGRRGTAPRGRLRGPWRDRRTLARVRGLADWACELWGRCVELRGTIGERYLAARGCTPPPADGDLRYCPGLRHPSGYVGPGLVGLVTHAETREPLTLHRTWITAGPKKADVDPPRMLLAGHTKRAGVIRLWPDEAVTLGLLVGEGVESVLAAARDYAPAWSCIDAGGLEAVPVLEGIETLVVAADHDARGIEAATRCADRWAAAGVDVRVIAPRREGADWADAFKETACP